MMNFINDLFRRYKYVLISIIILLLIFGIIGVWFYFYYDNTNESDDTLPVESVSQQQNFSDNTDNILAGDSCILLVCNSENIGEAMFMMLLDFHIFAENIVITPLDMDISDGARSYSESYAYGGVDELIKSVEKVRNCSIDRYVTIDKNGLSELTDIMGKVELYVSEDYTYDASDKSYAVSIGTNQLEAEMLYGYFNVICAKNDGINKMADLLCTITNSYLSNVDPIDAQKLFEDLCNCVSTNITISDYYTCSSDIEYLLTHNTKCVVYEKGE